MADANTDFSLIGPLISSHLYDTIPTSSVLSKFATLITTLIITITTSTLIISIFEECTKRRAKVFLKPSKMSHLLTIFFGVTLRWRRCHVFLSSYFCSILILLSNQSYSEPCQTSKIKLFPKIVNSFFSQKSSSEMSVRVLNMLLYSLNSKQVNSSFPVSLTRKN